MQLSDGARRSNRRTADRGRFTSELLLREAICIERAAPGLNRDDGLRLANVWKPVLRAGLDAAPRRSAAQLPPSTSPLTHPDTGQQLQSVA